MRVRGTTSNQRLRGKFKLHAQRLLLDQCTSHQLRLVESALLELAFVQRYRNNQGRCIPEIRGKIGHRLCQHAPEDICGREHVVVLKKVYQLAKSALIAPVRGSLFIRRPLFQALSTEALRKSDIEALAAKQAAVTVDGLQGVETRGTDRQKRTGAERKTAETAIGRKQQGRCAVERKARDTLEQ